MKTYLLGLAIQFCQWAEKQPERGIERFGSDGFAWCLLGPGFAFVAGLAIYYGMGDVPAAWDAVKAIIW
jgi:hypothetical protein